MYVCSTQGDRDDVEETERERNMKNLGTIKLQNIRKGRIEAKRSTQNNKTKPHSHILLSLSIT